MRKIMLMRDESEDSLIAIEIDKYDGKRKTLRILLTDAEAINLKKLLMEETESGILKGLDEPTGQTYVEHIDGASSVIEGFESFIKVPKPGNVSSSRIYLPTRLTGRRVQVIVIDPPKADNLLGEEYKLMEL